METFSERLLSLMKAQGMNQKTLSALAGVSQGTISKYLNGQDPKSAELFRLAQALNVTMDYLYSGRNKPEGIDLNPRAEVAERKLVAIKRSLTALLKEF
ncbi:MAG: helix-turn-helix domain-containing protein [Candidatus Spyradenecus sp.]